MQVWTQGGVALPSRDDVAIPAGKDVSRPARAYAKPGSGFMPGYRRRADGVPGRVHQPDPVGKTFDAGPVVDKTKAAIDTALSGQ